MSQARRHWAPLALLAWLMALSHPSSANANANANDGVDVAAALAGTLLGRSFDVLEDLSGKLRLEDVLGARTGAAHFTRPLTETPAFGYRSSTYWIRLSVQNTASVDRSWLFEVAYPHLDHVTLFVPRPDGSFAERITGDMHPFSTRDLAYRNFVFMLDEPPSSQRTYYLRIATSGSVTLPLRAWTLREFIEHQYIEWAFLCAFYGVVFIMGSYNACLFLFSRERAYGLFSLSVFAMGLFQFSMFGHSFQFLLPNHAALAQVMLPFSFGLCISSLCVFARWHFREETPRWFKQLMDTASGVVLVATLSSLVLPYLASLVLLWAVTGCLLPVALGALLKLRLMRIPSYGTILAGWAVLIVFGAITLLRYAGYLPSNIITEWSLQIGAAIQFVLVAAGLSNRLDSMRKELARLNAELAGKVSELGSALTLAELATEETERATRAKDEFVATMSHELRTPLNAIINIPRGVLSDFALVRAVSCGACGSLFELEADEPSQLGLSCPECSAAHSLQSVGHAAYIGEPERTLRHLSTIERAGLHLLGVVNAILEDGHEPGKLQIAPELVEVAQLLQEVIEQMQPLASASGVALRVEAVNWRTVARVDPLRMRQILINLIGNGIKFSDGRGEVVVTLLDRGTDSLFSVKDQGIGIAREKQAIIFETFEQAHGKSARKFQGTGLGLYIARSLVRLHGGELWVESELGKGATFLFNIPHAPVQTPTRQVLLREGVA